MTPITGLQWKKPRKSHNGMVPGQHSKTYFEHPGYHNTQEEVFKDVLTHCSKKWPLLIKGIMGKKKKGRLI